MAAIRITSENFESEVLKAEGPVLIDFWAEWCGPCKVLLPVIEELAEEVTHAKICKVNVDEARDLAQKFNVMTIPTLIVMKNGEVVNKAVGVKPKAQILEILNV